MLCGSTEDRLLCHRKVSSIHATVCLRRLGVGSNRELFELRRHQMFTSKEELLVQDTSTDNVPILLTKITEILKVIA